MWTQRLTVLVPALAGLLLALAAPVLSAERVALVVGNSAYSETTALRNPVNDAVAMAAALRRLGFEVIEGRNLDREGFFDKIDAFDEAVRTAKMALFFYAGHGLQVGGRNYLAPVDMRLEKKQDLRRRAIELAAVLEVMDSETNLVILDACRNNPLAGDLERSLRLDRNMLASRGLARVKSTGEMLIAYATAPGNVAADGDGDHSPYTEALLAHIEKPGLSVQELFTEVTGSVKDRTGGKQTPWTNSSLSKVVGLVPSVSPEAPGAVMPASDRLSAEHLAVERVFWESVKDSTNAADLQAYLDQYPGGTYATLARIRLKALGSAEAWRLVGDMETEFFIENVAEPSLRHEAQITGLGFHYIGSHEVKNRDLVIVLYSGGSPGTSTIYDLYKAIIFDAKTRKFHGPFYYRSHLQNCVYEWDFLSPCQARGRLWG